MRRKKVLALVCWIALLAPAARARESVVYAITTSEAQSGAAVSKMPAFKTEIFAVDPDTGKQRLVFSDAKAPFFLPTGAIAAAGGRIFAEGIERNSVPPPISRIIIAAQTAITSQVLRSFLAWSAPRKTCSCR